MKSKTKIISIGIIIVILLIIILKINTNFNIIDENILGYLFMLLFCLFLLSISIIYLIKYIHYKKFAITIKAKVINCKEGQFTVYTPVTHSVSKVRTYFIDLEFFDGIKTRYETIEYLGTGKKKFQIGKTISVVYYPNRDNKHNTGKFLTLKIETHYLRLSIISFVFGSFFSILTIIVWINNF